MLFFNKRSVKIFLLLIIILTLSLMIFIERSLESMLNELSERDVISILTKVINESVDRKTKSLSYNNLVSIQTNGQGHIILMQPNLYVVNDISSDITLAIQEALDRLEQREIKIPVFKIVGIQVFSKFSPKLKAYIIPHGIVSSNIVDEFESVGINQTRHKIYLQIVTKVRVVIPISGTEIKVSTQVPLTEAVIVGQVPHVYIGVDEGLFKGDEK